MNLRFAAANRDDREYERVTELDIERPRAKAHLGYGFGGHYCLGAPLTQHELYWGFKVLTERIDEMWFIEGANDFRYQPNYFLRALLRLHIGFRRAA